MRHVEFIAE